jgi:hypothetical protein
MSAQPKNESRDGPDLGRAGQEQLEDTIAPPQVGSGFNVNPTVLKGIRNVLLVVYSKTVDQAYRPASSRNRNSRCLQLWRVALGPYSETSLPITHRRTDKLLS